jgi:hypothetical protein
VKFIGWSRARRKRYIRALQRRNLATRVAIDDCNRSTAIHEAGHAVAAVRLKLWLDYAKLRKIKNSDFLVITGGYIKLKYNSLGKRHAEREITVTPKAFNSSACALSLAFVSPVMVAESLSPGFS